MNLIKCLKKFSFVKDFEILDFKIFKSGMYLKARVFLKNNSQVFIREYIDERERNYSYHWQTLDGKLLARWDNAPHHKDIITHPHHKHIGDKVLPSYSITCEEIFKEIETLLKAWKV
jgi:hypothetical protein